MLRIPFLRNLLLLVLAILACMPLYTLFVLHPAYHEELIRETEDDATRFATYMIKSLRLEGVRLERDNLPVTLVEQVKIVEDDRQLIKLRFFAPDGEIVFSTEPEEIGKANTNYYFRQIVSRGETYSQVVQKDQKTAEGVVSTIDVVETYVPFMANGRFGGAVEVYCDITGRVEKFTALTVRTTLLLSGLSLGLLAVMILALNKAGVSLQERERAEEALRQINEELEQRIAERTAALSAANEQLTAEVAERTQAQMALSQALEDSRCDREKLDGILRSVGDGLVVTDHQLRVLHMNAAAERLLEVPFEKALGQPLDRLVLTVNLADKLQSLLSGTSSARSFDFELPGDNPKQPLVYRARFSWLESEQGEPGVILLIYDVTKERELDRLKNAFLGMAAHELNTPLAAILGFSELLILKDSAVEITAGQREEYLTLIHGKALELSRLVDDLLDISRVEAGQPLVLDYETVRLDELLREVVRPYQEKSPRHRFELHLATAQTEVAADRGRIRQVFNNLVSNAVKYSPRGGLIKVAVGAEGGICQVSVTDEGIGMTAEQIEHIFDRFYRADAASTAVHGVGLGMSIVRHIVQAHQGDIRVVSQPGLGTTVRVDLPYRPAA